MAKGSDVATSEDAKYEIAVAALLDGDGLPGAGDPEVVSRAIVERILASETFEQAFVPQELSGWKELLDVPVRVKGFHLNNSTYEGEGGSSIYAVADLELLDGSDSVVTVTCGGRNVVAQLLVMLKKGWMENPVKLTSRRTGEGYDALWLVAA